MQKCGLRAISFEAFPSLVVLVSIIMPLHELYRMAKAQPDSKDTNNTCAADQGSA